MTTAQVWKAIERTGVVLGIVGTLVAFVATFSDDPPLVWAFSIALAAMLAGAVGAFYGSFGWRFAGVAGACLGAAVAGVCASTMWGPESDRPTAMAADVVIGGLGGSLPQCSAVISGTAPNEDGGQVWVAHRDPDDKGDGDTVYYTHAEWDDANPGHWSLTTDIGEDGDDGHDIELWAFEVSARDSAFLTELGYVGVGPNGGANLYSKGLLLGLDEDAPQSVPKRQAHDGGC